MGAQVRVEKPWALAKTHPAVSSQAVGPFPHLGPEGGRIDMRDEEMVSPNTLKQGGVGNLHGWLRRKKGWGSRQWRLDKDASVFKC